MLASAIVPTITRDVVVSLLVVSSGALLATVHVALAFGLARAASARRALLALAIPPLAPVLGWRARLRFRSVLWVASMVAYAGLRVAA